MNNFNELQDAVKTDLSAAQTRAYEELRALWEQLRNIPLAVLPEEAIKDGANGTGYFDGLLDIKTPINVLYKGVDEWGRTVICWRDGHFKQQVMFDRYGDRNGMLISQRSSMPSVYFAEQLLYMLRQAVANSRPEDMELPFPVQGVFTAAA